MTLLYRPPFTPWQKALWGLAALALVTVAVSGVRALRLSPLPDAPPPVDEPPGVESWNGESAPLWDAVRVVERDPFHPERSAPMERFLLPDGDQGYRTAAPESYGSAGLRLVGTAVSGADGGFVMCQVGNGPPRIVRIGEEVAGLTLRSIRRGEAEFTRSNGTVVTLRVPGGESNPGGQGR